MCQTGFSKHYVRVVSTRLKCGFPYYGSEKEPFLLELRLGKVLQAHHHPHPNHYHVYCHYGCYCDDDGDGGDDDDDDDDDEGDGGYDYD